MRYTALALVLVLILGACINKPESQKQELSILKKLRVQELPFRDSTNFDNYSPSGELTPQEIDLLQIKSRIEISEEAKVHLNYQLPLSTKFHSIVLTKETEHEMYTYLITYDSLYNIIDVLNIAYDEIAESLSRIESDLFEDRIIVEDSYGPSFEKKILKTFRIEKSGKFTKTDEVDISPIMPWMKNVDPILLKDLRLQELPFRDSTNFENYKPSGEFTPEEGKLLNVESKIEISEEAKVHLNYQLPLSTKFHSIVLTKETEHEMYTYLITYDSLYNIIDVLEIAYDEIAESLSRIESDIFEDRIIVEESYNDYPQKKITQTTYRIEKSGKFTKVDEVSKIEEQKM